jgi:hypothetical protein
MLNPSQPTSNAAWGAEPPCALRVAAAWGNFRRRRSLAMLPASTSSPLLPILPHGARNAGSSAFSDRRLETTAEVEG